MRAQSPIEEFTESYMVQPPSGTAACDIMTAKEILQQQQEAEAQAARAEMKAFVETVNANQKIIDKVCRLYTNNRQDHKDLFQEITYQLLKGYPSFENKSKVSTWMYSVAIKTGAALYRQRERNIVEIHDVLPDIAVIPTEATHDDEAIAFMRRLGTIDRSILMLMLEGYTNQDIAPVIGLSEEATTMRVLRLKRKHKDFFQD